MLNKFLTQKEALKMILRISNIVNKRVNGMVISVAWCIECTQPSQGAIVARWDDGPSSHVVTSAIIEPNMRGSKYSS